MSKNTKSERTRGEILDAAWTLIAERGASVSLGEVAAAAGITRQSVYVHFG
ncbi:MAG: TetR family transcriptional regulator, partial [Parvibaculum sp.]|nr:TetR family transcriptional regulator [Parvibaculum sp.]